LFPFLLAATVLATPAGAASPDAVVVSARLRPQALREVPVAATVLDGPVVDAATLQHFEELVSLVPNLNWSGEGSRARYFQLRGVGELEQYEGAPNPSVGFILDDIDLSAIGGVATLFDVGQVEVLRGPQGTRYGANALGGLVYVRSTAPSATPELRVEATGGSDDTAALGVAAGGALPGTGLLGRIAVHQFRGDGFRDNAFSGADDTNGRDEFTLRATLRRDFGNDGDRAELSLLRLDVDNGYDAFAIDNGFTTYSDKPGRDAQQTTAAALRLTATPGTAVELTSITTVADSDIDFGFDADWGNDDFWAPVVYDFTQAFDRRRRTVNQELRLASRPAGRLGGADWTVGAWWLRLDEDNTRFDRGRFCDPGPCAPDSALDRDVASEYGADNVAVFGDLSVPLAARTRLELGLRLEVRDADYRDATTDRLAAPPPPSDFAARDRLAGGEVALRHAVTDRASVWARVARGYRAGNFNPSLAGFSDADIPGIDARRTVDPEWLWNYEVGTDVAGDRWQLRASAFLQDRRELQVRIPDQLDPGDPTTFVFFTDNADRGRAFGVEVEGRFQATERLALGLALGLLDTEVQEFATRPELEGRDFAHAPPYTANLNATWQAASGWFARADLAARGSFYFDYCVSPGCDDPESGSYQLLDLRAGRAFGPWRVELWARNVFDERYATRGFFFGNEPPDFAPETYLRLGDPRQAGLTVSYRR
jgi:outer membrane receptor protein involved in Fe transport